MCPPLARSACALVQPPSGSNLSPFSKSSPWRWHWSKATPGNISRILEISNRPLSRSLSGYRKGLRGLVKFRFGHHELFSRSSEGPRAQGQPFPTQIGVLPRVPHPYFPQILSQVWILSVPDSRLSLSNYRPFCPKFVLGLVGPLKNKIRVRKSWDRDFKWKSVICNRYWISNTDETYHEGLL